jgi:cyclophilin family peptidyl-prolyl cis-trans isomerase
MKRSIRRPARSRPARSPIATIEQLDPRRLLSATVTTSNPTENLTQGQSATNITLSNYFKDSAIPSGDTVVNIATPVGDIPLYLTNAATPITVANFLQYVNSGEYAQTIIHRSVPGFVIQGGGYTTSGSHINVSGEIAGEASTEVLTNTPGTIAMALSTGPNTATSEWFINLATNSFLDNSSDGGPFTVFGQTIYNGLTVANDIANLPIVNDSTQSGAWSTLPVLSGTNGATVSSEPASNLVTLTPTVVPGGLTYTVSSGNSSIVAASVNNATGVLSLTPGAAAGSTSVTVTAHDLGGGTAVDTFNVSVAPANFGTVVNGLLTINGTTGADQISVGQSGGGNLAYLTGVEEAFPIGSVNAIAVNGLAGNDLIEIGTNNGVSVSGGMGDDTLVGGPGNDTLAGGQGDDSISGGPGDDVLHGGQGNDTLAGGQGNDQLFGGAGSNLLRGAMGDDTITGGIGPDTMLGGAGNDSFFALTATNDSIDGGVGTNTAHVAAGADDTLFDIQDTLVGS